MNIRGICKWLQEWSKSHCEHVTPDRKWFWRVSSYWLWSQWNVQPHKMFEFCSADLWDHSLCVRNIFSYMNFSFFNTILGHPTEFRNVILYFPNSSFASNFPIET
jgi:hypothetical protein